MKAKQPAHLSLLAPLLLATLLATSVAPVGGQSILRTVKYFGFAEYSVSSPAGGVIEGTKGLLYGVSFFGGEKGNGTVFRMNADGTGLLVLKSFQAGQDAQFPVGTPILTTGGALYGAGSSGGTNNLGAIFRLNADGTEYSVLKSFTGTNGDGATPLAGLIQATNGSLYGTTYAGGASNLGTIFSIQPDGTSYTVRWSFAGGAADGAQPKAALIQGVDGALYGTTTKGGSQNQGTIFKLNLDGSGYQVIKSFAGGASDGAQPWASLVQIPGGTRDVLFGTTYAGGASSKGTLYKILPDGSGFQVLKNFGGASGANPKASLIFGTNGTLYGTTYAGGSSTNGTIFQIGADGIDFRVLKSFSGPGTDGVEPNGPLLQATDGAIYGTTARGGNFSDGTAFNLNPETGICTVLRHFTETGGDGTGPYGDVIQGPDGALYGVTQGGGEWNQGTVYKVNKDGSKSTVLKSFTGTGTDGCRPSAGLAQGVDGVLYGTAMYDSTSQSGSSTFVNGSGHIFRLNPDGTSYEMLRKFVGTPDGANPYGALLLANNGAIYGTTMAGGTKSAGTVFKLKPDGAEYIVLKSFQDGDTSDGARPYAGLIQGTDGVLYGTTSSGGTGSKGAIFKINLDGSGYALLRRFAGNDGATPWAPLLEGQDGALYGTTATGGVHQKGTVFKLNRDGTGFTVLKSFAGTDGDSPRGLTQAPNGILFGTTSSGGGANLVESAGTVFQLSPNGTGFCVLKTFPQNGEGIIPRSGLVLGSDSTLYGALFNGGRGDNYGTLFSLVPAPVLVITPPGSGASQLMILALPGRSYGIQRATSANASWSLVSTATIGSTGVEPVSDPDPPPGTAFYRASYP